MSDGLPDSGPDGVGDGGLPGSGPGDGPGTGLDGAAGGREIGLDDGDAREIEPVIIRKKMCNFVIKNKFNKHKINYNECYIILGITSGFAP